MRGSAPPHLSYPGVAERFKFTLPPGYFTGTVTNWAERVGSTGLSYDALVPLNGVTAGSTVNLYVVWSNNTTITTNTATWRLRYAAVTPETDAITASVAALDTAITSDAALATADVVQRTPAGVINAGNFLEGDWLKLRLDLSSVSGFALGTDIVRWHGVEVEVVRAVV